MMNNSKAKKVLDFSANLISSQTIKEKQCVLSPHKMGQNVHMWETIHTSKTYPKEKFATMINIH